MVQRFKPLPANERKILFILEASKMFRDDDGSGRYPFHILHNFSEGGYNVYLYKKMNFKKYLNLCKYGQFIYSIKNLKFLDKLPSDPSQYILAFDDENLPSDVINKKWKKIVYVNAFKPGHWKLGKKWLWIPYFIHAYQVKYKQNQRLADYRSKKKKIRAFFAGNTRKDYYSNPNLKKSYGQPTRNQSLKALSEADASTIVAVRNVKELYALIDADNSYSNKCIIFDTNRFTIHPKRWLNILSRMDFFFCFSGTDLPMCHNAIEAMALGDIPIISYQNWFFPPLEHKKNAIVYTDEEDLKKKIKEVLSLDESTIAQLNANVIDYYENHLSAKSFIRRFETNQDNVMTLVLHPHYVCHERDIQENPQEHFDKLSMTIQNLSSKTSQAF
jgi:hypothetical protein